MPFVHVRCLVTGKTIAIPRNVVSYIAVWSGADWILDNGNTAWNVLNGIQESFVL